MDRKAEPENEERLFKERFLILSVSGRKDGPQARLRAGRIGRSQEARMRLARRLRD